MAGGRKSPDLVGQRFCRLLVLSRAHKSGFRQHWRCLCDCGTETDAPLTADLASGHTRSCGCLQRETREARRVPIVAGQGYGRLTAIERSSNPKSGHQMWHCRCQCGNELDVWAAHLMHAVVRSCDCLRHDVGLLLREDLIGQRFGKLTSVEFAGVRSKRSLWRCVCACGGEKIVMHHNLKYGRTSSCGKCPKAK